MPKAIIAKLEDVAEALRGEYRAATKEDGEGLDGKFILKVDAVDGFALEHIEGLKTALGKERTKAETLERQAKKFEGIDPDKARTALTELDELKKIDPNKEADKIANTKVEAAKAQLVEAHGKEIDTHKTRVQTLTRKVEELLIDSAATAALAEAKGSAQLLLPHVKAHTRVKESDDGKFIVEVVDKDGNVRIDGKGNNMDIKALVAEMKGSEAFGRAFDAPGKSGSGKEPNNNGGGDHGQLKRGQMTAAEKNSYISEHGQEAYLKLPLK